MAALLIGYARVSTDQQDLTAQRDGLGVAVNRIYVDQGLIGDEQGTARFARSPGRLPRRRHLGGHQTRPACPVAA